MNYERYKIRDYKYWTVYLHANQYFLGRLYLWAKREDALDFMEMAPKEQEQVFEVGRKVNKRL